MSVQDMEPAEVLTWGAVMGLLSKDPLLTVVPYKDENGNYTTYADVTWAGHGTIRIRAGHSGTLAGDAAKADLVDLLRDLEDGS